MLYTKEIKYVYSQPILMVNERVIRERLRPTKEMQHHIINKTQKVQKKVKPPLTC